MNDTVTLLPNNNRLRQLVRDHGERGWIVIARMDSCAALNGDAGLRVRSPVDPRYERWLRPEQTKQED